MPSHYRRTAVDPIGTLYQGARSGDTYVLIELNNRRKLLRLTDSTFPSSPPRLRDTSSVGVQLSNQEFLTQEELQRFYTWYVGQPGRSVVNVGQWSGMLSPTPMRNVSEVQINIPHPVPEKVVVNKLKHLKRR